jgi:hypothetical protein
MGWGGVRWGGVFERSGEKRVAMELVCGMCEGCVRDMCGVCMGCAWGVWGMCVGPSRREWTDLHGRMLVDGVCGAVNVRSKVYPGLSERRCRVVWNSKM